MSTICAQQYWCRDSHNRRCYPMMRTLMRWRRSTMLAIADRLVPARTVTVDHRTHGSTTSVVQPNMPLVLPSASLGARRR
jgi:hypothetical protein